MSGTGLRWSRCVALLIAGGAVSVWWLSRYAIAVHRLTRGVGDTVFYGADGKPWFRLDEQRHDVPLDSIAPDLQHAVVAIEDRRFYLSSRHRSDRRRARRRARLRGGRPRRRRQHADAAAGAHAVPLQRPHLRPQGEGSARSRCCIELQLTEDADPRAVSQSHLPERRRVRRRRRCRSTCSGSRRSA